MSKALKIVQIALVICCTVFFFYLLKDFNSAELKNVLASVNPLMILTAMVFCGLGVFFKVLRLKVMTEQFGLTADLKLVYKTQAVSLLLAILTPARVGEVSKLYLLSENDKKKYPLVTNITLYEICVDFICISIISFLFVFFAMKNMLLSLAILLMITVVTALAVLLTKANRFTEKMPGKLKIFFEYLGNNKIHFGYKWYLTFPLTMAAWITDGIFQYFLLLAVDIKASLFLLVAISAIISILSIVSVLPLGLGVTDLSSLFLYSSFIGLENQYILYLLNSSRLFLVLTLLLMCLPFLKTVFQQRKVLLKTE